MHIVKAIFDASQCAQSTIEFCHSAEKVDWILSINGRRFVCRFATVKNMVT